MSDDRTLDSRVNRLETSQAALNQRVTDLGEQVVLLAPLAVSAAELRKDVKGFETDLGELKADLSEGLRTMHQRISDRDKTNAENSRSLRSSLLALTAAVSAAVITALGGVVVALLTST